MLRIGIIIVTYYERVDSMKNNQVLIICGPSMSGKTTLMNSILQKYPDEFYKLEQITTRPQREDEVNGKDYYFVELSDFELIKKDLIFRCEFANNFYGTIPEFNPDKIGIAVVNEQGIKDGLNKAEEKQLKFFIIGLNKADIPLNGRPGRTEEDVKNEFSVLRYANKVYEFKLSDYPSADEVVKDIREYFKIIRRLKK